MKISELIEHVAKDMLDDRVEMLSGASDELFSDALIVRHLVAAESILARRAWVLEDTNSPVTRIQLKAGQSDYPVDKSIIFIKTVKLSDSDIDLNRVGYNTLRTRLTVFDEPWDINTAYTENPGRPSVYSTDMGTRILRVRRAPDAAAAALKIQMTVVRMPVVPISLTNTNREPEVPEEFHIDLALYAAGMCGATANVDASIRALSKDWLADFYSKVAEARRERIRFAQSDIVTRFGGWARE